MSSSNENKFEELMHIAYPAMQYSSQLNIKYRGQQLRFDFFIPAFNLYVEIQGGQHFTFNKFFHQDKYNFDKAKRRDSLKEEWCDLNNYKLLILTDSEIQKCSVQEFKDIIIQAVC